VIIARRKETFDEAASVKGGPEAIPRPSEVVTDGGGVETRIDAAKEDS
jgi:hypothetical protein